MYRIHLLATRSIDETFPIPLLPRVTTSRQVSRLPYAPPPTHGLTQVIVLHLQVLILLREGGL